MAYRNLTKGTNRVATSGSSSPGQAAASIVLRRSDLARATGFTPNLLAGNALWLRSDLGVVLTNGYMTGWTDQSGNGIQFANTGITGSLGGVLYTPSVSAFNNLPAVGRTQSTFNSDSLTTTTTPAEIIGASTTAEWFTVVYMDAAAEAPFSNGFGSTQTGVFLTFGGTIYDNFCCTSSDPPNIDPRHNWTPAQDISVPVIYNANSGTNAFYASIDGSPSFTSTTSAFSLATGSLAIVGNSTAAFQGQVAEVIVYDRILLPTERAKLMSYLAERYSISILQPIAPDAISGLSSWWKADAGISSADITAGTVSSWTDQVQGIAAIQTVSGEKPIYTANGSPNGKLPSLTYSAAASTSLVSATGFVVPEGSDRTIICAVKPANTTNAMVISVNGSTDGCALYHLNLGGAYYVYSDGESVSDITTTAPTTDNAVYTYKLSYTTPLFAVSRNGVPLPLNASTLGPADVGQGISLFADVPHVYHSDADVYEYIAYDRLLTADEQASIEAYLTNKWFA